MKIQLLTRTPEPHAVVAAAARLCYSDSGIDELMRQNLDDQQAIINKVLALGHTSVLEHVAFSFGIEGVSRALSHQLVRHRLASYSQQSQRYVTADRPQYVLPPSITTHPAGRALAEDFAALMDGVWKFYQQLLADGIPAEDARFVLPNAAQTKLVMTMNARELHHFFTLRTCQRAQWEIRIMATHMLKLCRHEAPLLFETAGPGCLRGSCPEGAMGCGQADKIRKDLAA